MNPCICDCHRAAVCRSTPCRSNCACPGSLSCIAPHVAACHNGSAAAPVPHKAHTCQHDTAARNDARCSSAACRKSTHIAAAASWRIASACWCVHSRSCGSHSPDRVDMAPDGRAACMHGCSPRRGNIVRHSCAPIRCASAVDSSACHKSINNRVAAPPAHSGRPGNASPQPTSSCLPMLWCTSNAAHGSSFGRTRCHDATLSVPRIPNTLSVAAQCHA